ncbi:MAG TPA: hypothetical protein VJI69_02555 [Bacteroidia bacterium]|nr:hypothetical protein [Bacteroidia bacterium]
MNPIKIFSYVALLSLNFILTSSFINPGDDKKKKKEIVDPSELYSIGEIKAMSADSIPYGTYVALSKEIINRKEKKIYMKSISIDQKGETTEYNYTMNITDPTFTIMADDSSYTGTGKLHGAEWKWSSWSYIINTKNPVGKIDAYNYLSLVGLVVNKAFYGADGKLTVRYKERYKAITKEQFEILYLQVLKCSTK